MAERKYTGKKKQKTKKASTGKYVCPACGERFTGRKDANKHQYEKNHSGAIRVEEKVEPPKVEPKKTTTVSKDTTTKNKKRTLMNDAKSRYVTKINAGIPSKTAISQVAKSMRLKPNKIKGWLETLKGENRRIEERDSKKDKQAVVKTDKKPEVSKVAEVPEVPDEPGVVHRFCRISDTSYDMIKVAIDSESGIVLHTSPETKNNLICCISEKDYYAFDYMMFLYDFVEIEMEMGDIMYVLDYYSNKKGKLTTKLKIHDISEKLERSIGDIDDGGCITIGYDESESLTVSQLLGRMGEFQKDWMACAGGSWDKLAGKSKIEPAKKEEPKALPAPKEDSQTTLGEFTKSSSPVEDKVIEEDVEDVSRLEELEAKDVMALTEDEWTEYQRLIDGADNDVEETTSVRSDDVPLTGEKNIEDIGLQKLFEPVDKTKDDKFNQDAKVWNQLDGYGAEDSSAYYGSSYYNTDKATTPKKKGVSYHPVYGIDIKRIYTDRVIDVLKFHPPE